MAPWLPQPFSEPTCSLTLTSPHTLHGPQMPLTAAMASSLQRQADEEAAERSRIKQLVLAANKREEAEQLAAARRAGGGGFAPYARRGGGGGGGGRPQ